MKIKWNRITKKTALLIVAVVGILTVGVGSTYAVVLSHTANTVTNTFTIGSVETEIYEDTSSYGTKTVQVVNTGDSPCLIRVRVHVSPEDAGVTITGWDTEHWSTLQEDGYYYYLGVLSDKGENATYYATPALFTGYTVAGVDENGNVEDGTTVPDFSITVYQESIQYEATNEVGETLTVYDENGNFSLAQAKELYALYESK